MKDILEVVNWDTTFNDCYNDVEKMWNQFMRTIIPILNRFAPLRTVSKKNKNSFSAKVNKLCRKAWKLHKIWKQTNTPAAYEKYLKASKIAQREKRIDNFNKENKILNSGNLDSFWNYVKTKLTYKSSIPCLLDQNKSIVSDSKLKADLLNDYFCSVFTKEDNIDHSWKIDEPTNDTLSSITVTPVQVFQKLKNLPPKLSSGPDGLPSILLKKLASVLDVPLSKIFNASIEQGKIPDQWREATVSALHKKGEKNNAANYRPISLTCVSCRVLESIIADSLKIHLMDALFEGQHGFLSKRSTVTQLLESVEDWVNEIDSNKSVDIAFIDFAKAFDSVSHKKLISKLKCYGISGKVLEWITNFLKNRIQRVLVDGKFSEKGFVTSGVPQGSVLGPFLFIIFINDLPKHIQDCILKLFADDCKIYFAFKMAGLNSNPNALQIALNNMSEWADGSQMKIQPPKCGILHIGKNNPKMSYTFGNQDIPNVESVRDLGVLMNANLSFDQHIETIAKGANVTANLILRMFKCKKHDFMMQMFNTFVRPKLEYASQIWNPHYANLVNRVEKVQRKFTKRLPERSLRISYNQRLLSLKCSTLELRRLHLDLIFLYKILHGHFDIDYAKYFEFKTNRTRGNSWALVKKYSNKDIKKFSFAQRIVNIWNFLPENTVTAVTVPAFKKSLHSTDFDRFLR